MRRYGVVLAWMRYQVAVEMQEVPQGGVVPAGRYKKSRECQGLSGRW